jgi:hypothetical protein
MPFLQKPYMPESLLEQVAALLENRSYPRVSTVDKHPEIRHELHPAIQ